MSKLIRKAWDKPMKARKFYKCLKKRDISTNIATALKACLCIQYYFLYGPYEVFQPYKKSDLPLVLLSSMHTSWLKILETPSKVILLHKL